MKERNDTPSNVWNVEAVAQLLKADAHPHQDVLAGPGFRLDLKEAMARLELYPGRLLIVVRKPCFSITLANVRAVEPESARLRIEAEDARTHASLFFEAPGSIIFNASDKPEAGKQQPAGRPEPERATPPSGPEPTPSAQQPDQGKGKERERVTLTGRLGRDPELRYTEKGRAVAKISLATRQGDKTLWKNVLIFDEKAEEVNAGLHKGDLVTVIAYPHNREVQTKSGVKKQLLEYFAAAVQHTKKP